ncbi:MAG TPA: OpgC domain-containing protein [Candidatus Saccharimonadales bacterium]|nr:OpgC domain-containing protein [Candidatus Saccharimonadales bacterium]
MPNSEEDVVVKANVPRTKRILAFDLIRGLFLIIIMIDHIELTPSGWDLLTGKGELWVSAAEGFFFLSGLLIGMIYRRRIALGMKFIFKKMWKRAIELYVVGTGLTLLYLCWFEFSHHAPIKDVLPSPLPWHHIIEQALLMRFTYGWSDFLVRFAILMLIAPFVFYLIAKGKWWLALAGVIVAWIFRGQGFTLSWQLIFNLGIFVGFYWQQLDRQFRKLSAKQRRAVKRGMAAASIVTFSLSYASVFLLSFLNRHYDSITPWLRHLTFTWNHYNADIWVYAQKWTMGPWRVAMFFLWFTTLYWFVRRYEQPIARYSYGLLELLGRNSLFVYTAHSVIVFAFYMYLIPAHTGLWQNFLITALGLVLLIAITRAYKLVEPFLASIKWPHPGSLRPNRANS